MAVYPDHLTREDLLELSLLSAEEALHREQLNSLELQRQNAHLMLALLDERASRAKEQHTEAEQKLLIGASLLEQKYGVKHRNQVDWKTGLIRRSSSSTEDPGGKAQAADPGPSAGTRHLPAIDPEQSPQSVGSISNTASAGTAGAGTPEPGGAEGFGFVVAGVPEE